MPTTLSDATGPFGRTVPLVRQIKSAVEAAGFKTPVVATGGIGTFSQAEAILQRGDADIVGFARQALADPDWFLKVRLGRGEEVRRCTYTNYCEALDQAHKQVTCKLWDRVELDEPELVLAEDGRRRLIPPDWKTIGAVGRSRKQETAICRSGRGPCPRFPSKSSPVLLSDFRLEAGTGSPS